ncbi:MAG: hypothetical protein IKP65_04710 [Alphaproteobacteria bacterium]|nr:hypothetical protein [Alphaproteobacteria bacterium]
MSGTLGAIRRQQEQLEKQRKKIIQESNKAKSLEKNREAIIAEICKTFGWTELDDFAKDMIDNAFKGKFVDIKKLKKDLAEWKENKNQEISSS